MQLKLKESPKEWLKFTAVMALALLATAAAWYSLRQLRREPARPVSKALRDIDRLVASDIK